MLPCQPSSVGLLPGSDRRHLLDRGDIFSGIQELCDATLPDDTEHTDGQSETKGEGIMTHCMALDYVLPWS